MKFFKSGNWGLRILALILAIVIYHALKTETSRVQPSHSHDRPVSKSK